MLRRFVLGHALRLTRLSAPRKKELARSRIPRFFRVWKDAHLNSAQAEQDQAQGLQLLTSSLSLILNRTRWETFHRIKIHTENKYLAFKEKFKFK